MPRAYIAKLTRLSGECSCRRYFVSTLVSKAETIFRGRALLFVFMPLQLHQ
ncbi:MAG TPA: hypothetical protein VMU24_11030 [Candidatus Acidoferrales bacterium]|nr:hypothetical protein [Candidatus Acidoferrales bacterium]